MSFGSFKSFYFKIFFHKFNYFYRCIVSVWKPTETEGEGPDGIGTPLFEILKLTPLKYLHQLTYTFPNINQTLAECLLGGHSDFYQLQKYQGVLSCVEDERSLWLQLEGDDILAESLTNELTEFVNLADSPELTAKEAAVGRHVVAQQNDEKDLRWYRARIVEAANGKYTVLYLDYGNYDIITLDKMKPLISYFAMNKCFALQVSLPIETTPENAEAVADTTMQLIEDKELTVYLQHEGGFNFAWIKFGENKSLAHELEKKGLGTLKLKPNPEIPFAN